MPTLSSSATDADMRVRRARPWVLLCEPNETLRGKLAELLCDLGFAVAALGNAEEAAVTAKSVPRLTALIVNLRDGAAVAETVRREQPDVRVLCLSGTGREPTDIDVVGRLLSGMERYVSSPRTAAGPP